MVKAFRDRNYRVVANSRSIKPASDEDILTAAGDIADPATAKRLIAEGLERFGRIDTLVNNAGIFIAKRFTNYTEVEFAAVVSTNLGGLDTKVGRFSQSLMDEAKSRGWLVISMETDWKQIFPTEAKRD